MSDQNIVAESLQGTVTPMDSEAHPFQHAQAVASETLALTRERLALLRKQRLEINAEIRLLVEEEELLARMARVRRRESRGRSKSPRTADDR